MAVRIAVSTEAARLRLELAKLDSLGQHATIDLARGSLAHALAQRTDDPSLLVAALEHTEAAWASSPGSAAAGFNRALISAEAGLCRRAAILWRSYLPLEPGSPWAEEASLRLSALPCNTRTREATPELLVDRVLEDLLAAWVDAPRPEAASGVLREIRDVGAELDRFGEPFVARLADELERFRDDPNYLRGIAEYTRGRAAFAAERYEAAGEPLRRALPLLERKRSVLAPWCQIWLAGLDLYAGRFTSARARLADSRESELTRASPILEGRVFWTLGLAEVRAGELGPSFDSYTRAGAAFERGPYPRYRAAMGVARSEIFSLLGLARESWEERIVAIRDLQGPRPLFNLHNALVEAARDAGGHARHRAAEAFLEEAVLRARDLGQPYFLIEALLAQGDQAARRGERAAARKLLEQALDACLYLPEGVVRRRFEANARLGLLGVADAAARPLDELASAAAFYAASGPRWRQLLALRLAAETQRATGDATAAEQTLGRALEVVRLQGDGLASETEELAFLEAVRGLFDERIAAAINAGDEWQALTYLDASRQLAAGGEARPRELATLLEEPPDAVVVVFGLVGAELLWWRLLDSSLATGRIPAVAVSAAIEPLIHRRYRANDLERAFDLLLAAPLTGAPPGRRLALVPDGPLHRLPFAALRNSVTGVRLIDERAITMHPTLSDALTSHEPPPPLDRGSWRAVTVGDPAFDGQALPSFERLERARKEAREVAAVYGPESLLLTAAEATPAAVREALAGAQVFHFAGHAVPGAERSHGALVLAREPAADDTGLVPTDDLLPDTLNLKLVVLSACASLGRQSTRAGGALGPARPFLRRGVPAVLATLWPIEDGSLGEMLVDFHHGIIEGLAASEALRRAQVRAARKESARHDWAALQLVGELPAMIDDRGD